MRIFSVLAVLLALAGCGEGAEERETPAVVQEAGKPPANRIACMPPGESEFTTECTFDRSEDAEGPVLTARLPDGGFHRFRPSADGLSLITADGAEPAGVTTTATGEIEVTIGGARYRLPTSALSAP